MICLKDFQNKLSNTQLTTAKVKLSNTQLTTAKVKLSNTQLTTAKVKFEVQQDTSWILRGVKENIEHQPRQEEESNQSNLITKSTIYKVN